MPTPAKSADTAATANHQRALALVNEGDRTVKVDVEAAIAKYTESLQLEPDNVDVLWKLSRAYDKKEDWVAVATTLERASRLAPHVAHYARWRGHALVQLAHESDSSESASKPYEAAREPLTNCLKLDPKLADCAFLLGEVEEWAEHAQVAAELYTRAIRLDSGQPHYYRALAALYRVFKQANESERVLVEGMARVQPSLRHHAALARMSVSLAQLSAVRHDAQASQHWLEQAEANFDEGAPEVAYQIGAIYASEYEASRDSSKQQAALRLLSVFVKRTCRGAAAAKFKEECALSSIMIQVLGSDAPPRRTSSPVAPPATTLPLAPGMPSPKLEMQAQRVGETFTVWGAGYAFRSRRHHDEVTDQPVAITGYVVKTNLEQAPRCAVHRAGMADPENCHAAIPAFWLGDRPDAPESDCIKVMGFASTYAQLYEAIRQADSPRPEEPYSDSFWGQTIPNPLPARGAKLRVRGRYGLMFAKASSGAESDPIMGILDFAERDVLEPAPELAILPGVKRVKPRPSPVPVKAGDNWETIR